MKTDSFFKKLITLTSFICMSALLGCQSSKAPLPTVAYVDLESFMGTWYVAGYTPLLVDGKAHNATEHYNLKPDGRIQVTYQFRNRSFDGPPKTYRSTGFVHNQETNAEWRIQFIWPFKAAYLIVHYDEAAGETIIGHPSKKYAWIMLRKPDYKAATYERLLDKLVNLGYRRDQIKRLPQDWSNGQLREDMMKEATPFAISRQDWRKANNE